MIQVRKERRLLPTRLTCWGLGVLGLAIVISIMSDSTIERGFAASNSAAPVLTTSTAGLTLQAIRNQAPDQTTYATWPRSGESQSPGT